MRLRQVRLLPEIDERLVRYSELQGLKPEEVIAAATESHLRFVAEQAFRLADARNAHEKAHPYVRPET